MVLHLRGAGLCRLVAAVTALTLAAAGCSYQSTYVAPQDGRARVVWGRGDVPTVEMSGAGVSGQCSDALQGIVEHPERPAASREMNPRTIYITGGGSGYWSPRYYGPPIVIVRPGLAPPFLRPPIFLPRLSIPVARPVGVGSFGGVRTGGSGARGGGGGSGGGGNFGKDAGVVVLALAVIAATTLPAVALGLAASMPESSSKSASAIDRVNAYNDLARFEGTPCTPAPLFFPPGEPVGYPAPQELPQ